MRRKSRDEVGASMVEFAITFPLLLLLLMGIIEFSYFLAVNNAVETAAREGARYATAVGVGPNGREQYIDCIGIRDAARARISLVTLDDSDITVFYDEGPGTALEAYNCNSGPFPTVYDVANGGRVIVTVTSEFSPLTQAVPFYGSVMGGKTLISEDRRTIFPGNL